MPQETVFTHVLELAVVSDAAQANHWLDGSATTGPKLAGARIPGRLPRGYWSGSGPFLLHWLEYFHDARPLGRYVLVHPADQTFSLCVMLDDPDERLQRDSELRPFLVQRSEIAEDRSHQRRGVVRAESD